MKDKYDIAIEFLTQNPRFIQAAWKSPNAANILSWEMKGYSKELIEQIKQAHCLFQYCTVSGKHETEDCGCLTQVYAGGNEPRVACTVDLTEAIKADDRLATDIMDVNVRDLPVYAEWQRRMDREIRTTIGE